MRLILLAPFGAGIRCWLEELALRHGRFPIDLSPPFSSSLYEYEATLNFVMQDFSVDVRASTGCDVEEAPIHPVPLPIGLSKTLTVYARSPDTGERKAYIVRARRLLGSETDLQSLRIEGAEFSTPFDPTSPEYSVRLGVGVDVMRILYVLRDGGQHVRFSAGVEHPAQAGDGKPMPTPPPPPPKASNASNASTKTSRRLEAGGGLALLAPPQPAGIEARQLKGVNTGEAQFIEQAARFLVDDGFGRRITITVQSADPTQATIGTYVLNVRRPACPPDRPYFRASQNMCVNNCGTGEYQDDKLMRCTQCNTNCHVCTSFIHCKLCIPDDPDYTYTLQADGTCTAHVNHLFQQYMWWFVASALSLVMLMCFGCAGLLSLCGRKSFAADSDSDSGQEMGAVARRGVQHDYGPPRDDFDRGCGFGVGPRRDSGARDGGYGGGGYGGGYDYRDREMDYD